MGSGGLIVMDEDTCMVDTARSSWSSARKSPAASARHAVKAPSACLRSSRGYATARARKATSSFLKTWQPVIKDSALCGLGQTAPNPVLSTIKYFRHEYEAHIYDKKCPAGVCSKLFKSPCQHACPIEMDVPAYIALIRAGRIADAFKVMKQTNPFPAVCGRVCPQFCSNKCRRGQLDEPMAIAWLKRYISDNAKRPKVDAAPVTRKEKIAVIGAGPAGLTAAQDLAIRGYKVTVFEELPFAGGMMRYAIPEYRMPRDIVRRSRRYRCPGCRYKDQYQGRQGHRV